MASSITAILVLMLPGGHWSFIFNTSMSILEWIPDNIPDDVSQIILSFNAIQDILNGTFSRKSQCLDLYLNNNKINTIEVLAFKGLFQLEYLNLKGNQITEIRPEFWTDLKLLQVLKLHKNRLSELPDGAFEGLNNLKSLYLQENKLKAIRKNTFSGLTYLNRLDLGWNMIRTIEPGAFSHLNPFAMKTIDLGVNRVYSIDRNAVELRNDSFYCSYLYHMGLSSCKSEFCWFKHDKDSLVNCPEKLGM